MFRFSQTRASPSQTHALRTFDQHSATCARSVLPAGSAAHNSVLGCVCGKARSAAHTGVLKQLGSCNRKLSAVPASTRSGRCFQTQKQRNCSSLGQGERISRRSARSTATHADRCLPAKQGPGDPVAPARQVHFPAVCAVHSDARRSMPPGKARTGWPSSSGRGWTRWNNGQLGRFCSYESGDMTRVTAPRVGANVAIHFQQHRRGDVRHDAAECRCRRFHQFGMASPQL